MKINTLDSEKYEKIQQKLIDALDQGTSVRILGGNGNRTDLTVRLHSLKDCRKETIFAVSYTHLSGPFLSAHLLHRQLWGERPERPLRQR